MKLSLEKKYQLEGNLDSFYTLYDDDLVAYNFYNSLIDKPNRQNEDSLKRYFQKSGDLERILLWATNSKTLVFDSVCQKIVEKYSFPNVNIRQVAHVALAFYWANKMMDKTAKICFKKNQKKLQIALLNGIAQEKSVNDNWLEGLVGLICLNKKKMIKKEWVERLKNEQNPDGGWAWDKNKNSESHPHPTMLAFWILLEME